MREDGDLDVVVEVEVVDFSPRMNESLMALVISRSNTTSSKSLGIYVGEVVFEVVFEVVDVFLSIASMANVLQLINF